MQNASKDVISFKVVSLVGQYSNEITYRGRKFQHSCNVHLKLPYVRPNRSIRILFELYKRQTKNRNGYTVSFIKQSRPSKLFV
jgi:hypothetical protein